VNLRNALRLAARSTRTAARSAQAYIGALTSPSTTTSYFLVGGVAVVVATGPEPSTGVEDAVAACCACC
jgi:hypothetical protein